MFIRLQHETDLCVYIRCVCVCVCVFGIFAHLNNLRLFLWKYLGGRATQNKVIKLGRISNKYPFWREHMSCAAVWYYVLFFFFCWAFKDLSHQQQSDYHCNGRHHCHRHCRCLSSENAVTARREMRIEAKRTHMDWWPLEWKTATTTTKKWRTKKR